jgi:hypothetical protein
MTLMAMGGTKGDCRRGNFPSTPAIFRGFEGYALWLLIEKVYPQSYRYIFAGLPLTLMLSWAKE